MLCTANGLLALTSPNRVDKQLGHPDSFTVAAAKRDQGHK
jgi:hypothetical protein